MQSLLIFIAEFQTAQKRFLKNFELSDDCRFSRERNDDAQGRIEQLSILKSWKGYSMYERRETTSHEVLPDTLRAGTKTESASPNTPRIRLRSFLKRFKLLMIFHGPKDIASEVSSELDYVIQTGNEE
jgi:hypothetical protein